MSLRVWKGPPAGAPAGTVAETDPLAVTWLQRVVNPRAEPDRVRSAAPSQLPQHFSSLT